MSDVRAQGAMASSMPRAKSTGSEVGPGAEFEGWVAAESWAAVILPSAGETAAYFRGSQARPDNGALVPNASPEADEVRRHHIGIC